MARFTLLNQELGMDEPSSATKEHYVYFIWCHCPDRRAHSNFSVELIEKILLQRRAAFLRPWLESSRGVDLARLNRLVGRSRQSVPACLSGSA